MDKYIKTCAWAGGPPLDPKHPTYKPPQIAVLDCGHGFIGNIVFASWGDAEGECSGMLGDDDTFKKGGCNSDGTSDAVEKLCLGKHKCELPGDETGGNAAYGTPKGECQIPKIAVVIECGPSHWGIPFLIILTVIVLLYFGGGTLYTMKTERKSWASHKWNVLPHGAFWSEGGDLVVDGLRFTKGKVHEMRTGMPYRSEYVRIREETTAAATAAAEEAAAAATQAALRGSAPGMGYAVHVDSESDEDEYELWTCSEEEDEDGEPADGVLE